MARWMSDSAAVQGDFADITITNCLQLTSLALLFTYIRLLSNENNEKIWKNALFDTTWTLKKEMIGDPLQNPKLCIKGNTF